MTRFMTLYAASAVVMLALDLLWLGIVAKDFYQRHLGSLMRPDVRWGPALLFYALYLAALVVFVVGPAVERRSLAQAVGLGAFFGLAAYATFDLTSLALIRDFPLRVAVVDLIWGAVLSGTVSGLAYGAGIWLRA